MKNLLGDWSRSVERSSAQANLQRQIFCYICNKKLMRQPAKFMSRQWDGNISEGPVASLLLAD
jgi:hypothetical protein